MARVLIVDAQAPVRLALRRQLEGQGHACTTAETLEAGLEELAGTPCALVLADEVAWNGLIDDRPAGLEQARVVVMAQRATLEQELASRREGATDCLAKPLDFEAVRALTERLLAEAPAVEVALPVLVAPPPPGEMLFRSESMQELRRRVETLAPHDISVLITGESGTGKELVARALHENSPRRDEPFVAIHCGAIPPELLESELFGHERGSFTDAHRTKPGKFEIAGEGTLFLDEIGEMSLELQVKLLRVLQEREVVRIGGLEPIPTPARIVAATHRDLRHMVAEGRMREDLLHRLEVATIHVPPLRERPTDIELLAAAFAGRFATEYRRELAGLSQRAVDALRRHRWPGNVRELENLLRRAVVLSTAEVLDEGDLPLSESSEDAGAWEEELRRQLARRLAMGESPTHLEEELRARIGRLLGDLVEELRVGSSPAKKAKGGLKPAGSAPDGPVGDQS